MSEQGDALDTAGRIHLHDWGYGKYCMYCGVAMEVAMERLDDLIAQYGGIDEPPFSEPTGKPRPDGPDAEFPQRTEGPQ